MKKTIYVLVIVISIFLLSVIGVVYADTADAELSDEIGRQLDELNLKEFENFANDYLNDIGKIDTRGLIENLIDGDVSGVGDFFEIILKKSTQTLTNSLIMCVSIIIICVLYNTQSAFLPSKNSLRGVVHYVLISAVLVLVIKNVYDAIDAAKETINVSVSFMNVLFPILISLLTVSSGGAGASIFSPIMAILANSLANLISNVVFPVFLVIILLSIVGNLTDSVKLDSLKNFLKSSINWILGIAFGVFSTISAGAGVLTSGISTGFIRFTKNSLTNFLPSLGQYLSGGVDVVSVGSILIKNSVGVVSLIVMFAIIIVPVIKCLILSLSLSLSAGVVESFCDKKVVNALNGISSGLKNVIFSLLGLGSCFFVLVMGVILSVNFI